MRISTVSYKSLTRAATMLMQVRVMMFAVLAVFLLTGSLSAEEAQKPTGGIRLYMPDGQLESHPIRVYIDHDVTTAMKPELWLIGNQALMNKKNGEKNRKNSIKPMVLSRNQEWMQMVYGNEISAVGTLMLFDLGNSPIPWYQPAKRYTPTLIWQVKETKQYAVGNKEVYVVNRAGTFFCTFLLVGLLAAFIAWRSKIVHGSVLGILCGADGSLSLWRTQVAGWTLAIGGLVTGYGLTRLELPDIPESLIALMGMSLGTAGVSHYQMLKKRGAGSVHRDKVTRSVSDLICDILPDGDRELSLSRAQMLFWTVIMLAIFIVKSVMNGELWEVPWEMVALMGISQTGYLTPRLQLEKR